MVKGSAAVDILDLLKYSAYVLLVLLFIYVVVRVMSYAYFESKREYLSKMFTGGNNGEQSRQEDEE